MIASDPEFFAGRLSHQRDGASVAGFQWIGKRTLQSSPPIMTEGRHEDVRAHANDDASHREVRYPENRVVGLRAG